MRSILRSPLWLALLATPALATEPASTPAAVAKATNAPPPPQLRGILAVGKERQFSLVSTTSGAAAWVKLGAAFDGWKLADYKIADEVLLLSRDGENVPIRLAGSDLTDARSAAEIATVAEAEELLRKMDFERMLVRTLEKQKASMPAIARKMNGGKEQTPENQASTRRLYDLMFEAMKVETIKEDVAKLYTELFTKDEMRAMMSFYATPAGRAVIENQPEISQRIHELLSARVASVMPQIREEMRRTHEEALRKATGGSK